VFPVSRAHRYVFINMCVCVHVCVRVLFVCVFVNVCVYNYSCGDVCMCVRACVYVHVSIVGWFLCEVCVCLSTF